MKYTQTAVQLADLTLGENPRIPTNMGLDSLIDNIEGAGLLEPISVWEKIKGKFEIIRGYRRHAAITAIAKRNPARFAELFGKGIPALKWSDVTADEVVVLKLDHSEQRGLTDPHELQRSANMFFAIGKTEAEVAIQLAGLIDKINPMRPANRAELEALRAKVQAAKQSGNDAAATLAQQEADTYLAKYRRGFVQNLHNTYRAPAIVMQALYKKATGLVPEGVTSFLPPITTSDVTSLWKAHSEDLKILEAGVPKYNRERVGPNFTEKWTKLCTKAQAEAEGGDEKEAKPKAMSAKDMSQEIKDGAYKSELACKLTAHHCGDKAIDDLVMLDEASYWTDLVRKYDKVAFETMVKNGKEIQKRLIAADQKANG